MKEARIECFTKRFLVPDLGLTLRQGDVEWVVATDAKASKDLTEARRVGAVRVRFVTRSRMAKLPKAPKAPAPPNVRLNRKRAVRRAPQPAPAPPAQGVTREDVAQIVRDELRTALQGHVGQPIDKETLQVALKETLSEVLGGTRYPVAPAVAPAVATQDEPVFIPTNIVDKDAKAAIKVQTEATESTGLDEAAAALKAAKPKSTRKRASRKKTTA